MNPAQRSMVMQISTMRLSARSTAAFPSALFATLLLCAPACQSGQVAAPAGKEAPVAAEPAVTPGGGAQPSQAEPSRFGAAIQPGPAIPLAALLSNPSAFAAQTVTTEGQVQRACSRKGCWMEIGSGGDACRVTFKDYGFFVPTDSAGAFAKIQGRLDTREVEKAAVDHLEAEGARFRNKKADGSATEVRLVASAVELRR
jgi:hypothetical protein